MPRYIVKPKRDEDFYVVYSTIVDAPARWGTRAELAADPASEAWPDRMERADEHGTSAMWGEPPYLGWDETEITVREGFDPEKREKKAWSATVARDDLREFCESIGAHGRWDPRSPLIIRWTYFDEDGDVS